MQKASLCSKRVIIRKIASRRMTQVQSNEADIRLPTLRRCPQSIDIEHPAAYAVDLIVCLEACFVVSPYGEGLRTSRSPRESYCHCCLSSQDAEPADSTVLIVIRRRLHLVQAPPMFQHCSEQHSAQAPRQSSDPNICSRGFASGM